MIFGYKDRKYFNEIHLNADDVNYRGELTLKRLMLLFQKVALLHYTQRAQSFSEMMNIGKAWVLTKIEIDIESMPVISDNIIISTWSRGANAHKGIREFSVTKNGYHIIKAQTQWAYLDFKEKKLSHFKSELFPQFEQSEETHFKHEISSWRIQTEGNNKLEKTYQLRQTDFDINRHLNNTTYFEILEDYLMNNKIKPKHILAAYAKEVPLETRELLFKINESNGDDINCHLEFDDKKAFMVKIARN